MKSAYIILGNQLLRNHPALENINDLIYMIEAHDICSKLPYHKHKLILILASMRNYRDYVLATGRTVRYAEITSSNSFLSDLEGLIKTDSITLLKWMQTSDVGPQKSLVELCERLGIKYEISENRQFLTSREGFDNWYNVQKAPLMESFYRWERKRTGILMNGEKPVGGKWNFDSENRKSLPKSVANIPSLPVVTKSQNTLDVMKLVDDLYPGNPGKSILFWLPTDFKASDEWLTSFVSTRFANFGDYEDASRNGQAFLYHSVLSPLLNCGLLTPDQVIHAAQVAYESGSIPLNSFEGFVRQIIGWREYMYGMYRNMPDLMTANYFGLSKQLEDWWYTDAFEDQDLPPPIKAVLRTVHNYGYNHHIERLMVLGNWFLLNEYDPLSVYRWFSSMYVDAYEWVMVPNVQGMSQYADGGVIATKPYVSGGNYLQKMGNWWPSLEAAKQSSYNRLYWRFIYKNRALLKDNFRMSIVLKMAEKMNTTDTK